MARWVSHRADSTAKNLIAAARQLGAKYQAADGTFDGVLWLPGSGRVELIDWKSSGSDLTPSQVKLVAAGWPLRFLSTPDQVQALVRGR